MTRCGRSGAGGDAAVRATQARRAGWGYRGVSGDTTTTATALILRWPATCPLPAGRTNFPEGPLKFGRDTRGFGRRQLATPGGPALTPGPAARGGGAIPQRPKNEWPLAGLGTHRRARPAALQPPPGTCARGQGQGAAALPGPRASAQGWGERTAGGRLETRTKGARGRQARARGLRPRGVSPGSVETARTASRRTKGANSSRRRRRGASQDHLRATATS